MPDGKEAIAEVLGEAWKRSDLILVTGGLGPTSDDLTRDVVAEFFKRPLEYKPEIHEKIFGYFRHRNLTPPELVKVQAMVPQGMEVLTNDVGTAPGFWFEEKGKMLAVLPDACIIEAKAAGAPLVFEMRQIGVPVSEYTPVRGNDKFVGHGLDRFDLPLKFLLPLLEVQWHRF